MNHGVRLKASHKAECACMYVPSLTEMMIALKFREATGSPARPPAAPTVTGDRAGCVISRACSVLPCLSKMCASLARTVGAVPPPRAGPRVRTKCVQGTIEG